MDYFSFVSEKSLEYADNKKWELLDTTFSFSPMSFDLLDERCDTWLQNSMKLSSLLDEENSFLKKEYSSLSKVFRKYVLNSEEAINRTKSDFSEFFSISISDLNSESHLRTWRLSELGQEWNSQCMKKWSNVSSVFWGFFRKGLKKKYSYSITTPSVIWIGIIECSSYPLDLVSKHSESYSASIFLHHMLDDCIQNEHRADTDSFPQLFYPMPVCLRSSEFLMKILIMDLLSNSFGNRWRIRRVFSVLDAICMIGTEEDLRRQLIFLNDNLLKILSKGFEVPESKVEIPLHVIILFRTPSDTAKDLSSLYNLAELFFMKVQFDSILVFETPKVYSVVASLIYQESKKDLQESCDQVYFESGWRRLHFVCHVHKKFWAEYFTNIMNIPMWEYYLTKYRKHDMIQYSTELSHLESVIFHISLYAAKDWYSMALRSFRQFLIKSERQAHQMYHRLSSSSFDFSPQSIAVSQYEIPLLSECNIQKVVSELFFLVWNSIGAFNIRKFPLNTYMSSIMLVNGNEFDLEFLRRKYQVISQVYYQKFKSYLHLVSNSALHLSFRKPTQRYADQCLKKLMSGSDSFPNDNQNKIKEHGREKNESLAQYGKRLAYFSSMMLFPMLVLTDDGKDTSKRDNQSSNNLAIDNCSLMSRDSILLRPWVTNAKYNAMIKWVFQNFSECLSLNLDNAAKNVRERKLEKTCEEAISLINNSLVSYQHMSRVSEFLRINGSSSLSLLQPENDESEIDEKEYYWKIETERLIKVMNSLLKILSSHDSNLDIAVPERMSLFFHDKASTVLEDISAIHEPIHSLPPRDNETNPSDNWEDTLCNLSFSSELSTDSRGNFWELYSDNELSENELDVLSRNDFSSCHFSHAGEGPKPGISANTGKSTDKSPHIKLVVSDAPDLLNGKANAIEMTHEFHQGRIAIMECEKLLELEKIQREAWVHEEEALRNQFISLISVLFLNYPSFETSLQEASLVSENELQYQHQIQFLQQHLTHEQLIVLYRTEELYRALHRSHEEVARGEFRTQFLTHMNHLQNATHLSVPSNGKLDDWLGRFLSTYTLLRCEHIQIEAKLLYFQKEISFTELLAKIVSKCSA